jgi:CelD/BcsL family acetyltransferase involved in cellulose biosynthesis
MFVYQSRFLRRGEVWFDNEPNGAPVDWILYRNRSAPVRGARSRRFYNRLIDLSKSPEQLLSEMEPKTAAKIKAATQEDKLSCEWSMVVDARQLDEIEGMWNQSIEAKRRWGNLNRAWLSEMIRAGAFELTAVREPSGALVVFGGLFRDKYRAQQLMSVSPPRAALVPAARAKTNRASCFLLWNTLLRLKDQGVRYFDFGGWYPGTEDIQLLGANAFKKSLGGEVVGEFECEQIVSLKGWVALTAARLIARAKEFRLKDIRIWESHPDEATA